MTNININADHDSWVYEALSSTNFGSDTIMKLHHASNYEHIAYIKWSDLSDIPANAIITSATCYLYVSDTISGTNTVQLAGGSWSEGSITWNNQPDATGGTLFTFNASSLGWKTGDLTDTVKDWHKGNITNNGVRIITSGAGWAYLDTSETANEPYLSIDYKVPVPKIIIL